MSKKKEGTKVVSIVPLLSRDAILNAQDLKHEDVEVPEWEGSVRVRTLTSRERDNFEAGLAADKESGETVDLDNIRARLVSLTVVDAQGKRLFSAGDLEALGGKSGAAVDRLFDVARRLAGMSDSDVKQMEGN